MNEALFHTSTSAHPRLGRESPAIPFFSWNLHRRKNGSVLSVVLVFRRRMRCGIWARAHRPPHKSLTTNAMLVHLSLALGSHTSEDLHTHNTQASWRNLGEMARAHAEFIQPPPTPPPLRLHTATTPQDHLPPNTHHSPLTHPIPHQPTQQARATACARAGWSVRTKVRAIVQQPRQSRSNHRAIWF
jgi:hypothetical protein